MSGARTFRRLLVVAAAVFLARPSTAQQEGVLQINDPVHRFLERQQAAGRLNAPELSQLPLSAYEAARLLDSLAVDAGALPAADRRLLARFRGEVEAPGAAAVNRMWGALYGDGRHFLSARSPDWAITIEPMAMLSWGKGQRTADRGPDDTPTVSRNTRGVRVAGHVAPLLFFEGRLASTVERAVDIRARAGSAPRHGMVSVNGPDTYDVFESTGIVGLRTRYLEARAGRDRSRWGPAQSSVSLSNYAAPFDQVQLRARFWRIAYTSLFAGFSSTPAPNAARGDRVRRRKYGSLHRLDVSLPGRVQFGVFESVVFATDSLEVRERFDWTYANPMIFLRAAERDRGSPDNAMLGSSLAWVPVGGVRLYGEILLDEFSRGEIGKQWWANKFAWVAGLQLADVPLRGLQARYEFSRVRPYTYAHRDEINAFTHFADPLGFPGGANAVEHVLWAEWTPTDRLSASLVAMLSRQGRDTGGVNYGSDPTQSYDNRAGDYDQAMLQGVRVERMLLEGQVGYEVLPSLVVEGAVRIAATEDAETGLDRWITPFVQLRWGMPFPWTRY